MARRVGQVQPWVDLARVDREALHEFRRVLRREGYAETTVAEYLSIGRRAAVDFEAHGRTIKTATASNVLGFFDRLPQRRPIRRLARKAMLSLYRTLGRSDERNPARVLPRLAEADRKPRPLSLEDYTAFLAAATSSGLSLFHETIGVLFATTGCRFEEVRTLRWDRVTFGDEPTIEVMGKGAARRGPSLRVVPLHPLAVDVLRRWRDETGEYEEVFPTLGSSGDGLRGERSFRDAFAEIVDIAGIEEHVTPHRLRHSVATYSADRTKDLRAVGDLLGHRSLATTQRYVGLLDGRTREAVAALPVS